MPPHGVRFGTPALALARWRRVAPSTSRRCGRPTTIGEAMIGFRRLRRAEHVFVEHFDARSPTGEGCRTCRSRCRRRACRPPAAAIPFAACPASSSTASRQSSDRRRRRWRCCPWCRGARCPSPATRRSAGSRASPLERVGRQHAGPGRIDGGDHAHLRRVHVLFTVGDIGDVVPDIALLRIARLLTSIDQIFSPVLTLSAWYTPSVPPTISARPSISRRPRRRVIGVVVTGLRRR